MLLSKLLGERYREMPADVNVISYALMLKGAYIRPIGNGIFTLLPPAKKVIKKIENIIREERRSRSSLPCCNAWRYMGRIRQI